MHPPITREQIFTALRQFDQELRDSTEWAQWEHNIAHKWAISYAQQRYPVKQIVALAGGVATHTFSGGEALNRRIARLGFTVERLPGREPLAAGPSPDEISLSSVLQERIAELELRILAEQTRARLALAALATTVDLAQHAQECPNRALLLRLRSIRGARGRGDHLCHGRTAHTAGAGTHAHPPDHPDHRYQHAGAAARSAF